jgi:UDP-N-acetylmuramate--alanine ligase
MAQIEQYKKVFLIGIGGIGMSALARFFRTSGYLVAGYDRVAGPITNALADEGIEVLFDSSEQGIPEIFRTPEDALVVYTPAVPDTQSQLMWFREQGFDVLKRSRVLGMVTESLKAVCVAGTHGKTTVSTITAFLFHNSRLGVNAFLGGISKNFGTNFLGNKASEFVVLEADEFDRSFWQLTPYAALITSMDADHLDIYGNADEVKAGFDGFARRIRNNGWLLLKAGLPVPEGLADKVEVVSYSITQKSDYQALDIREVDGKYVFDVKTPGGVLRDFQMGIPGLINVENTLGAIALSLLCGITADEIRAALPKFEGIARRFDVVIRKPGTFVYIDDYAHHPEEIRATLKSVRAAYPGCSITGVFQPHLFSRTRDFAREFSESLEEGLDNIILLPVYPAREEPIPGVTSEIILDKIKNKPAVLSQKEDLIANLEKLNPEVLITMGAGDIDRLVPEIRNWAEKRMI